MRRPRFRRWIRAEVLRLAGVQRFSLRKLAAQAQRDRDEGLAAALLMYAHENDQVERLLSFVYDDALREGYQRVERNIGQRSLERLALRGTPMMVLPLAYRHLLGRYEQDYHAPESATEEKRALQEKAHAAMLESGTSPAEVAHALGLDHGNTHAFLVRGEIHRFTLGTCREIEALLRDGAK